MMFDLYLTGDADTVLPMRKTFEEQGGCLRDTTNALSKLLYLPPLGAGELGIRHSRLLWLRADATWLMRFAEVD